MLNRFKDAYRRAKRLFQRGDGAQHPAAEKEPIASNHSGQADDVAGSVAGPGHQKSTMVLNKPRNGLLAPSTDHNPPPTGQEACAFNTGKHGGSDHSGTPPLGFGRSDRPPRPEHSVQSHKLPGVCPLQCREHRVSNSSGSNVSLHSSHCGIRLETIACLGDLMKGFTLIF